MELYIYPTPLPSLSVKIPDQNVWDSIFATYKCQVNLAFHIASGYQAILGTWCIDPRLDQQLQVARCPPTRVKNKM